MAFELVLLLDVYAGMALYAAIRITCDDAIGDHVEAFAEGRAVTRERNHNTPKIGRLPSHGRHLEAVQSAEGG